jgi:hypothetical protein
MTATCAGCPRRWTSTAEAHCGSCHAHFHTAAEFDGHRRGGQCCDPATAGLIEHGGVWGTPAGHVSREAKRQRMSAVRAARPRVRGQSQSAEQASGVAV